MAIVLFFGRGFEGKGLVPACACVLVMGGGLGDEPRRVK